MALRNSDTGAYQKVYEGWVGGYNTYSGQALNDWTAVATGDYKSSSASGCGVQPVYTLPPADDTTPKQVPLGMGWLLYTGAVPDGRSLYCPSATDVGWTTDHACGQKFGRKDSRSATGSCVDTLREWLEAGPMTKETLTSGNWPSYQARKGLMGYGTWSQYCYRNMPIFAPDMNECQIKIAYTSPAVYSSPNCPPFKTARWLGSRAVASDSFMKGLYATSPGFGVDAHIDGYNVLYGDSSNKWYSDVERRIIYWEGIATSPYHKNYQFGTLGPRCYRAAALEELKLGPLVWHTLDKARGVDTSVDVDAWTL